MSWNNLQGITEPANKQVYATGFKSVTDYKLPRSKLAAAGFYFFHLAILLILSGIAGGVAAPMLHAPDKVAAFEIGIQAGHVVAFIYAVAIIIAIYSLRKLWGDWRYIAVFVVTLGLAFIGGLFGLLPSAIILAMKPKDAA